METAFESPNGLIPIRLENVAFVSLFVTSLVSQSVLDSKGVHFDTGGPRLYQDGITKFLLHRNEEHFTFSASGVPYPYPQNAIRVLSVTTPTAHGVKEKLHTDAIMYNNDRDRVNDVLQQTTQPIFKQIFSWTRANKDTLTVDKLIEEIQQYMGIQMLAAVAKKERNVIVMRSNETVNAYYHRIFSLWEDAETPAGERMNKLLQTMKPSISQSLLGHKYASISDLLDAARNIEDVKRDISSNFPRQDRNPPSKTSRNWNNSGTSGSVRASTGGDTVAASDTNSMRTRDKLSGQDTNRHAKLIPTSVKPAGWPGTWFKPEKYPKKLENQDRITLARGGRC